MSVANLDHITKRLIAKAFVAEQKNSSCARAVGKGDNLEKI